MKVRLDFVFGDIGMRACKFFRATVGPEAGLTT